MNDKECTRINDYGQWTMNKDRRSKKNEQWAMNNEWLTMNNEQVTLNNEYKQ